MKKKATLVNQLDKAETSKSASLPRPIHVQKMYRDHTVCDHHLHGRVNKFPFGANNGPIAF